MTRCQSLIWTCAGSNQTERETCVSDFTLAKMVFTWRGTLRDACGQKNNDQNTRKIISEMKKQNKHASKAVLQSRNQSPSGPGCLQTGTLPVVPVRPGWRTPVKPAEASLRPVTSQTCGDDSDIVPVGQTWRQGPGRGPQIRPPAERWAGVFRECRNFPQLELHSRRLETNEALLWGRMTDFVKMSLIAVFKFSYSLEASERITADDNLLIIYLFSTYWSCFPQDK